MPSWRRQRMGRIYRNDKQERRVSRLRDACILRL